MFMTNTTKETLPKKKKKTNQDFKRENVHVKNPHENKKD